MLSHVFLIFVFLFGRRCFVLFVLFFFPFFFVGSSCDFFSSVFALFYSFPGVSLYFAFLPFFSTVVECKEWFRFFFLWRCFLLLAHRFLRGHFFSVFVEEKKWDT